MEFEQIILGLKDQVTSGAQSVGAVKASRKYSRIISCGMGGSQIPAEMLSTIVHDIVIHWGYDLPSNASPDDLVICTSWSGNTEETISSYEKAISLGIDTIVISDGGKLIEMAKNNKTPFVDLPNPGIPPRTATGFMLGALSGVLDMQKELEFDIDHAKIQIEAHEIAEKIGKKVPLIYSSYPLRKSAGFWKICFNENTKIPAFANWLPSAAHNELASLSPNFKDQYYAIILRQDGQDSRYERNIDALVAFLDKMGYNHSIVKLSSSSQMPLEKVFSNYILAIWTSYYLARLHNVDAQDTSIIEEFKKLKQ